MKQNLRKAGNCIRVAGDFGCFIYLFLMLLILPFYFTEGYNHIGTDKAMFFRTVNGVVLKGMIPIAIGVVISVLMRKDRSFLPARREERACDAFFFLYAVAVILSYEFSNYREDAFYGAAGWYMGLFTQLCFVLFYFFISRMWVPRDYMFYSLFLVSMVQFVLGFLNRFGIEVFEMESASVIYISTIGNINWYCGYIVCVLFFGVGIFWKGKEEKWQRWLMLGYLFLGFCALVAQGSASGIVALAAVFLILFWLSADEFRQMMRTIQLLCNFSLACIACIGMKYLMVNKYNLVKDGIIEIEGFRTFSFALLLLSFALFLGLPIAERNGREKRIRLATRGVVGGVVVVGIIFGLLIVINSIWPGSIGALSNYEIFNFSDSWGSYRGATWSIGIRCFLEQDFLHKMFGVGPDAMSAFLYQDASDAICEASRASFGERVLTNAHNEWITQLVDVGILGVAVYAGLMISVLVNFFRRGKKDAISFGVGLCVVAYLVNNLFSFQTTMNGATIFTLMAMGTAWERREERGNSF